MAILGQVVRFLLRKEIGLNGKSQYPSAWVALKRILPGFLKQLFLKLHLRTMEFPKKTQSIEDLGWV